MLENFFNRINQDVDKRADALEKKETPSSQAPTIKILKSEDLEPVAVASPSEKAPTIPVIPAEHVTELVEEKDIHGPLEAMGGETLKATDKVNESDIHGPLEAGAETLAQSEAQTLKTDATVGLEKEVKAAAIAESAPTVRVEETMGLMEYDVIQKRVDDWLKRLDKMLAIPQPLEELVELKAQALKIDEEIESQYDEKKYGDAKVANEPFIVKVPTDWSRIEARLNEIDEGLKADTLREQNIPTIKEEPTIKEPPTIKTQGPEAMA